MAALHSWSSPIKRMFTSAGLLFSDGQAERVIIGDANPGAMLPSGPGLVLGVAVKFGLVQIGRGRPTVPGRHLIGDCDSCPFVPVPGRGPLVPPGLKQVMHLHECVPVDYVRLAAEK